MVDAKKDEPADDKKVVPLKLDEWLVPDAVNDNEDDAFLNLDDDI